MRVRLQLLLLVFFAIQSSACFDPSEGGTRGPYLQNPSSTTMVVRWRTGQSTMARVDYGTNPEALYLSSIGVSVPHKILHADHEVLLDNLMPNTRYYYTVSGLTDDIYSFKTPPLEGSAEPTRIWILGDSGTADDNARSVRDNFYKFNRDQVSTDLMIMLGDMVHGEGTDVDYQSQFFEMYNQTLHGTPIFPTLGNHEARTKLGAPYLRNFTLPVDGKTGGFPSGTERFYSFNYANIHFVSLDSATSNRSPSAEMYSWLVADLTANTQDWTVVFFHHPPYSKGSYDTDTPGTAMVDMRVYFTPLFEMFGVDLVFSGHSHVYERSFPIIGHQGGSSTFLETMKTDLGDGRADGDGAYVKSYGNNNFGIIYTVLGTSGKVRSGPLDHPAHYIGLAELGSVVLDFDGDTADVIFLGPNSSPIDYYTIEKVP